MATFTTRTGERLGYRADGEGPTVVVVPGGPGRDADYLEGLGGLARRAGRRLVILDPRGTGSSPRPASPSGYSAARVADDLEDLRVHLELDRLDLVAHSAGCAVAFLYAASHPERVGRLVLVTPATRALGLTDTEDEWERQQAKRRHEPWFADACAAIEEIERTRLTPDLRQRMSPLLYGAWTDRARAHAATDAAQRNREAAIHFHDDLPDPFTLRDELGAVTAPVRILLGDLDMGPGPELAAAVAALFPDVTVVVQPEAGHFPWVDDTDAFVALMTRALTD